MNETEKFRNGRVLKKYVNAFPKASVLVIGDIIMDQYVWGDVSRISPEAPVPVVEVVRESMMLGGAANVIFNISTLGGRGVLCGVVGKDPMGRKMVSMMKEMGLPTNGVVVEKGRPTSIKTRVVAQNQQVVRFDRESRQTISSRTVQRLLGFVSSVADGLDAVVVADYGKGVISLPLMKGLREVVQNKGKRSVVIAVDPKTGNFESYHGVDVITPNHHEAGAYCGFAVRDEETLIRAGRKMIDELRCRSVLITRGKDGMTLFEDKGRVTHIPTVAKQVFDVTGAGDTVIGTFSLGLASGLDLQSAAVLSNLAAGIVVGEVGTSTVKAADLKRAIDENRHIPRTA